MRDAGEPPMSDLGRIAIVLVETSSPGNLGSVARVMKNMGLGRLILVDCQAELNEEARQRARGADELLEKAVRNMGLGSALEPFHLSVATSSRQVRWFDRALQPREMAARLNVLAPGQHIAIVFGPERTGLTNEHLQHCQWQVRIPTDTEFPSLNLAHAVAILAYELSQSLSARPVQRVFAAGGTGSNRGFFQRPGRMPERNPISQGAESPGNHDDPASNAGAGFSRRPRHPYSARDLEAVEVVRPGQGPPRPGWGLTGLRISPRISHWGGVYHSGTGLASFG